MTRPYFDFRRYKVHVVRRLAKLDNAFVSAAWQSAEHRSLFVGALVLELDNIIIQSLRAYALSVIRQSQRAGSLVLPGRGAFVLDDEYPSIVTVAFSKTPTFTNLNFTVAKRDEGKIRDPSRMKTFFTKVVGKVPASFTNASALNCNVFSELRDIRHFYAHRCEDTFRRAMQNNAFYLRGLIRHPDEFVAERIPGRSSVKIREWIAETEAFFSVASQR